MTDEVLRELEHALAAAPHDGGARLRLAQALARVGRRREALDRLDVALVGATWFDSSKQLADELWADELARLQPSPITFRTTNPMETRLDGTGSYLAWSDATGALRVGSLVTGDVIFEGRGWLSCAARNLFFVGDGSSPTTILECSTRGVTAREIPFTEPARVLAASPDGSRIATHFARENDTACGIFETATLAPHFVEAKGHLLARDIDWEYGVLELRGKDSLELRRFSGETLERRRLPGVALRLLGRGLVAEAPQRQGLRLGSLLHGWRFLLGGRGCGGVELAPDGRGVRFLRGSTPRRIDVDFETGKIVPGAGSDRDRIGPEPDATDAELSARREFKGWHPRTDAHVEKRRERSAEEHTLRTLAGRELLKLPRTHQAISWTPDGHGLVLVDWEGRTGEARFEVWRATD